jgi:polysaccharide export outer membrane protein
MRRTNSIGVAVLLVAQLSVACAYRVSTPVPLPPDPDPDDREAYTIGVTDVLRISVWKNPELEVVVPVRPDGKVSFPLLDDVQAEGLKVIELKDVIARELVEFIVAPDVTVIVVEMNSQFVSVLGAVVHNGRVPITRDLRVMEAIALSGGFTTFAKKSQIRIVRRGKNGEELEYRFNYDAYLKGRAPGSNIVLKNGDTIIVPL